MNRIYVLVLLILFQTSCSPHIQYVGRTYQPTEEVDTYFNPADIKREYETMGRVEGIAGMLYNEYSDIQEAIIKVAKHKGADGVLIYNMGKRTLSQNTNSSTRIGNGTDIFGKQTTVTTSSSTNAVTQNTLQADFIKYK
ncbi:hypothetical protein [Spirosoma validum]|uniref:Uncharacterized protein n=1 Tax=Spirosoma validum TaxID=2771355 RepID=A0A927GGC9_9BACT|nr:hypothetical protein [Spirosoma validum]MBD2756578.1 hypothetical protein [Spirosoma validum]